MSERLTTAQDAAQLLESPLLIASLNELEAEAVEVAVSASITDHDTRAAAMVEVRAIRNLVTKLKLRIAEGKPRQIKVVA